MRKGDIQVTVSTAGRSPALAQWLKERIDALLDDSWVEVLELLAKGLTNEDLASVLGISPTTARTHPVDGITHLGSGGKHRVAVAIAN